MTGSEWYAELERRLGAVAYVLSCDEDDGPSDYEEAATLFAAIFGRRPDADDGSQGDLWSHICAAVNYEEDGK